MKLVLKEKKLKEQKSNYNYDLENYPPIETNRQLINQLSKAENQLLEPGELANTLVVHRVLDNFKLEVTNIPYFIQDGKTYYKFADIAVAAGSVSAEDAIDDMVFSHIPEENIKDSRDFYKNQG